MNDKLIKIYLVDDDEDDYVIIRDILTSTTLKDYEIEWESDYNTAQNTIELQIHDVYLIDYFLGEGNGIELIKNARESGNHAPMIIITGVGGKDVDLSAMSMGASDYLIKGQITHDILERSIRYSIQRAKDLKALRENELRYRILFNSGNDAILVHRIFRNGSLGNFTEVNSVACKKYNYQKEEFLQLHPFSIVAIKPVFPSKIDELFDRKTVLFESYHKSKDGKEFPVEINAKLFEYQGDLYVLSVIRDITERKEAEIKLKENEKKLHTILTSSPDIIFILDFDFVVKEIYTSRYDLLYVSKEEILQQKLSDILPEKTWKKIEHKMKEAREKPSVTIDYSIPFDKEVKYFSAVTSKIKSNNLKDERLLFICRDITENKKVERLREDVQRMIRHDLKVPLTAIIGFSEILIDLDTIPENEREWIYFIYNSGYQMLRMINNSFKLFQMEEGNYELMREEFDLIKMFRKLHQEFVSYQKNRNIDIVYFINDKTITWHEKCLLSGEPDLIETLCANILKNALEAAPDNTNVTINIIDNDDITIDTHNLGIIPERIQGRFFERYTTYGKKGGTGLGTYSAMLITQVHGGNISFTSTKEEGTHLIIKLPKHQA